ncbi:hypothetical protein PEBR_31603 [Penicillium brasilianum]|uniref:Acetamidase n=1 Tax=Penicillium brasilianum TaxID=104259 RepID=A0A1S9RF85_PENBI|nr:hypothetical protein PEBR_31603 [Penicillium brasilianum]
MEILVHVSAPSSARDDARYRAQVAAILALEPISRQSLISNDGGALVAPAEAPPPADQGPEHAENAKPAASSLLLQASELISAPSSVSHQSVEDARAAIAGQPNGAGRTSSDSRCDRDLMHQREKKPLGNLPSPRADDRPQSDPLANDTATATVPPIANSNPSPCLRHDRQSILPGPDPGTNQIRPSSLIPAPAHTNQIRNSHHQIGLEAQLRSRLASDSLESIISVIPDSQPELAVCTRRSPPLHEEDQPAHPPKRRRVEPCSTSPSDQTISKAAALESTTPSCSAHHEKEKTPPGHAEQRSRPPLTQGPQSHSHTLANTSPSPFPRHIDNPASASANAAVSVIETEQQRQQPPIRHDHPLHQQSTPFSKSLPLTLRPPPPPISTSTFKTHITPTLAMLIERLKPARTYKPTHQSRELDTLERGYWAMRVNIAATESAPAREKGRKGNNHKGDLGAGAGASTGPSPNPQTWTEPQFSHFWTFLSSFIAKDARAGWGVWCIAERVDPDPDPDPAPNPLNAATNKARNTTITTTTATADDTPTPVLIKVYAWGEVAMHIYLMLYLASERRVRGMGLRWVDSWEEVVIQMP